MTMAETGRPVGGRVDGSPRDSASTGQPGADGGSVGDVDEDEERLEEPSYGLLVAGTVLVVWTLIAALVIRYHPGTNAFDRWGESLVPPARGNSFYIQVAGVKSAVLVGGSILAAVVVVARDRWRALACLIGPLIAVLLVESVIKPYISRRLYSELTFPSGTVTAVAGVAAAWAIAVPRWLRWPVVVLGALVVTVECRAVVALQWHFPSDAIAGAAFGVGVVLVVDGLLHVVGPAAVRSLGPRVR